MLWFFIYLIPGRIGIYKFWFMRRGKLEYQEKTSWSKEENQQQTQPTYGIDVRSERSLLSPLSNSVTSCTKLQK